MNLRYSKVYLRKIYFLSMWLVMGICKNPILNKTESVKDQFACNESLGKTLIHILPARAWTQQNADRAHYHANITHPLAIQACYVLEMSILHITIVELSLYLLKRRRCSSKSVRWWEDVFWWWFNELLLMYSCTAALYLPLSGFSPVVIANPFRSFSLSPITAVSLSIVTALIKD